MAKKFRSYRDLSCDGADDIDTRNIDRLADQGMKLTDFYALSRLRWLEKVGSSVTIRVAARSIDRWIVSHVVSQRRDDALPRMKETQQCDRC